MAGLARPPRTREEASNGGCGEAPARLVCSDSVFLIPSVRSCLVATPKKASASIDPSLAPDHVGVSVTARVRYVVWSCGSFLSAVVFMCGADADGWI